MADPWTFAGELPAISRSGGALTLIEQDSFCISDFSGDILPGTPQGLFVRDTRFLSRAELRVNGARPEGLSATTVHPFSAVHVLRSRPRAGAVDSGLLVVRSRWVGRGMREDICLRNFGGEPAYVLVELFLDADFAHTFEVKEGRVGTTEGERVEEVSNGTLVLRYRRGRLRRASQLRFSQIATLSEPERRHGGLGGAPLPEQGSGPGDGRAGVPAQLAGRLASFEAIVPVRGEWYMCYQLTPIMDDEAIQPLYTCGQPVERAMPFERMAKWRREVPMVTTDHEGLRSVVARSAEDLGALRLFDPAHPERAVIAAGAPWFMTLFGRDSIITSWMALIADPDLALGVLQTLAERQGTKVDPLAEEEPGRILHETRFGAGRSMWEQASIYYGTADATPLFVMLLGELRRWGLAEEQVDALLPHADAALGWIESYGDRDGDGYVEYLRQTDRGLANQGWKDSWDGIRYGNGAVARAPIALCEVQAYVYGAYLARAYFAEEAGDDVTTQRYRARAARLKEAFNRDFWLEDRGWFAIGLDQDKAPIDSLTSNIGHCLWTGIVDQDKAERVAAALMSESMFSGWGIRTLSADTPGYNPLSYHCGSVWPHDSAIVAAGLMRYGFVEAAQRVVMGLLDAAVQQGGRLPELFSGLARRELPGVVGYPTSCSPQAWSAASPLLALRTLLRLEPWVRRGKVWVAPALPAEVGRLRVDGIPLGGRRVTVECSHHGCEVTGLPPGVELVCEPRHPLTAAL